MSTKTKLGVGIWEMDTGQIWIRTTAQTPTGKIGQKEVTLDPPITLEEAKRIKHQMKAQIRSGQTSDPDRDPIVTVRDYGERWIARKAKRNKPSTMDRYVRTLADWIYPVIGNMPLTDITQDTMYAWVDWAESQIVPGKDRAYSTATLVGHWRILTLMMRDAHGSGLLDCGYHPPTYRVPAPDTEVKNVRETRTLSTAQLDALLDRVCDLYPHRYAEVCTLAFTGMRPGEMYALRWRDVYLDLDGAYIDIEYAVWRQNVGTVKTDDPRTVPLLPRLHEALVAHRGPEEPDPDALVFPSDVGTYRTHASIQNVIDEVAPDLDHDIHITPQVLRRTFNTILVTHGVDRLVTRSMMGHSGEKMTSRYAGIPLQDKRKSLASVFQATEAK